MYLVCDDNNGHWRSDFYDVRNSLVYYDVILSKYSITENIQHVDSEDYSYPISDHIF